MPDLRNLGTMLRILVVVNGAAVLTAVAAEPRVDHLAEAMLLALGMVQLPLFVVLSILWAGAPWLRHQPYSTGVAVAVVAALAGTLAGYLILDEVVPQPPGALARHCVFALLMVAALVAYFRLRARALSPALVEARLQALQARIRPHFLFNSINGVLSLVRSDPRRAEEALHDMADLFRVLMRDNRELTPLSAEVELCRQYLDLEKLRLGERLIVDWNVKSMPEDALVPPLLLQPLLENAVYHGIEPCTAPGTISVNIFQSRGEVHAILRNPYRADAGRHHAGNKMAMANIRERLALHFDAEATLESRVMKDAYEVHIRLPYRVATPPVASGEAKRPVAANVVDLNTERAKPRSRIANQKLEAARG